MGGIVKRTAEFFDKEILKAPAGFDAIKNVVIDAQNLPTEATRADGRIVVPSGWVLAVSGTGTDEVQTVEITGSPTGGTFTLVYNDEETSALDYDADAATIETALEALSNVASGDITVAGTNPDFTFTFDGTATAARDVDLVTLGTNALTGGSDPSVEIVETTKGAAAKVVPADASGVAEADVVGILVHMVEFAGDTSANYDMPAAAFHHGCVFNKDKLINYSGNAANVEAALSTCKFE